MTRRALGVEGALPLALSLGSIAAIFLMLELLLRVGLLNRFIIPLPSDVVLAFHQVVTEEHIAERLMQSAIETLAACVLVALVGIGIGIGLHQVGILRRATETWVAAFAAAPVVLAYPLFLVIFGRSTLTIVMMGFIAGLAPVILKTLDGLSGLRPVLIKVGRSYNITRLQQFYMVQMPAALPTIFVGLRLGISFALINVIGVEFLINFGGLGQLINELAERYDLPAMYAAIGFVILVSVIVFVALDRIEAWLQPWSGRR